MICEVRVFGKGPGPEAFSVGHDVEVGGDVECNFGATECDGSDAEDASASEEVFNWPRTGQKFGFEELAGVVVLGGFAWFRVGERIVLCWACEACTGTLDEREGFLNTCRGDLVVEVYGQACLVMLKEVELLQKCLICKVFFETWIPREWCWIDQFDGSHEGFDEGDEVVRS